MMVGEFYNSNQQSPKTSTRLAKVGRQPRREPDALYNYPN